MSIEDNINQIISLLSAVPRGKEAPGPYIQSETNIDPHDIDDAVKILRDRGMVKVSTGLNTPRPYHFRRVSLSTNGRLECERLVREKLISAHPDVAVFNSQGNDEDFSLLAREVRKSVENNEPEVGIDRLHTYLVMYFRRLCKKHGVSFDKNTPLHSLLGGYVKHLKAESLIESGITERILKSSISIMDAFNDIRNNRSLAHDNQLLNKAESLLVINHITSLVRYVDAVEHDVAQRT